MANLQNTESPISRAERNKINGNWEAILENFRHLQRQINILAGTDVEALIKTITDTIDHANQTVMDLIDETTEVTDQKVAEVNAALDNLSTLLASALQQMETARIEANDAATNANDKANLAQTAADDANTATANANTATQNTNEAISNAETATNQANTARDDANSAASLANDAAASASTAKDNAITAANEAVEATENVIDATTQANEVIGATITATEEANTARDDALQAAQSVINAIATMQADIQATKDAFAHKGEYNASVQYYKDNEVSFNGSTYRAVQDTLGNAPTPLVDNEYWLVVARRGVDGSGAVHSINNQVGDVVLEPSTIGAASEADLANLSSVVGEVDEKLTAQLAKTASVINVKKYTTIQDAVLEVNEGLNKILYFPDGMFNIEEPIIITNNNVSIQLSSNTIIKVSLPNINAFVIEGDNCTLDGGTIEYPSLWNGENRAWLNNEAAVLIKGNKFKGSNITLINVFKVGFGLRNANDCILKGNIINGNYPLGQWTEVETAHFGIALDGSNRTIITENHISNCVQGVFIGNYGNNKSMGIVIQSNIFVGTFDHAVYGGNGNTFTNTSLNTVYNCNTPFAATGEGHSIVGNTVKCDGTGLLIAYGSCVSLRDPYNCVVMGNNFSTIPKPSASVIVLQNLSTSTISGNLISGNILNFEGNKAVGIRINNTHSTPVTKDNAIKDNLIKGAVPAGFGLVTVSGGNTTLRGERNVISSNKLTITNCEELSWGVWANNEINLTSEKNEITLEVNKEITTNFRFFRLTNVIEGIFKENIAYIPAAYGTNLALRVFNDASSSKNDFIGNRLVNKNTSITVLLFSLSVSDNTLSRNKISADPMTGTAIMTSGTSSVTVNNGNVTTASNIVAIPINTEAVKVPFFLDIQNGYFRIVNKDFANTAANANYRYEIV